MHFFNVLEKNAAAAAMDISGDYDEIPMIVTLTKKSGHAGLYY